MQVPHIAIHRIRCCTNKPWAAPPEGEGRREQLAGPAHFRLAEPFRAPLGGGFPKTLAQG